MNRNHICELYLPWFIDIHFRGGGSGSSSAILPGGRCGPGPGATVLPGVPFETGEIVDGVAEPGFVF